MKAKIPPSAIKRMGGLNTEVLIKFLTSCITQKNVKATLRDNVIIFPPDFILISLTLNARELREFLAHETLPGLVQVEGDQQ